MTQHYADALSGEQGNGRLHPCQDYPTIFDRLAGSIQPLPFAWEYHAHQSYGFWSAPMAIQHFAYYQGGGPITNFVVDPDAVNYINTEAPSGNVASVTYLTPCPYDSDHPNETTTSGPKWVASILNAIGGNTNLWNQTAVFIVWDDWGGWFDHDSNIFSPNNVYPNGGGPPPNQIDPNEWGFRVPMIIVSPYVKQSGYISHTTRSFSAILNFIEWNWYLQSLNADDVADANYLSRPGDNLTDAFDFTRSPMQWSPISVGGYVPASPCPTP
jgi:hypothetical protein